MAKLLQNYYSWRTTRRAELPGATTAPIPLTIFTADEAQKKIAQST